MPTVYLGVGSNIERERYIVAGLDALQELFGALELSSVYDSAAVGFDGQPFLNLVAAVETELELAELARRLRHIEVEHGRPERAVRFSARQLDIDILTYGDAVGLIDGVDLPRGEILENAFVLCPLAELAPMVQHPALGKSFALLWEEYNQGGKSGSPGAPSQQLSKVDFAWRGRAISRALR